MLFFRFKIYNNTKEAESTIFSGECLNFKGGEPSMFGICFPIEKNSSYTEYTTKCKSFGNFEKDYEITNGEQMFSMQELEIFRILYD